MSSINTCAFCPIAVPTPRMRQAGMVAAPIGTGGAFGGRSVPISARGISPTDTY